MPKTIKFFALFTLTIFTFHTQKAEQNKIIYLISPPRSLSVAFLRMMQARGDFVIMHEPSQLAYDSIRYPQETHDWFLESAPQNFGQVKERIFNYAQNSSVFVKEISFAVQSFLKEDSELVQDPRVRFVFLLRDPHHATISFYKKCNGMFMDDEQGFSNLVGYKAAYELYKSISEQAAHKPLIILAENLYTKTRRHHKGFL